MMVDDFVTRELLRMFPVFDEVYPVQHGWDDRLELRSGDLFYQVSIDDLDFGSPRNCASSFSQLVERVRVVALGAAHSRMLDIPKRRLIRTSARGWR